MGPAGSGRSQAANQTMAALCEDNKAEGEGEGEGRMCCVSRLQEGGFGCIAHLGLTSGP